MAINIKPTALFGPQYSATASSLTIPSAGSTTFTSIGVCSFNSTVAGVVITTDGSSIPVVGDKVKFAANGTFVLPTEITAGTEYYVVDVSSASTFKISATKGGTPITVSASAVNVGVCSLCASVDDLTSTEVSATTGDWREILRQVLNRAWRFFNGFPSAGRPAHFSIIKSSTTSDTTGITTVTYTVRFNIVSTGTEMAPEA